MNRPQTIYYAYLLRLRWVDNAGQPVWRISLEAPGSQTEIFFESLAVLCAYLAEETGLDSDESGLMP